MKKLMFVFGLSLLSLVLIVCDNSNTVVTEKIYPEELGVSGQKFNQFVDSYNQFYENLEASKKTILSEYVRSKVDENRLNKQGRVKSSTCNCTEQQTKCTAETWWSSCCICCNPGTQAACGTYGPIPSCKCDDNNGSVERQKENYTTADIVTIYPKRFDELFKYAKSNSINVAGVVTAFDKLLEK